MIRAGGDGGFDPTRIARAVEAAGFGAGEVRIKVRGTLTLYDDLLALELPTAPRLLVLAAGERFDELQASGPPVGTRILIEGPLLPSRGDLPPRIEVQGWKELEHAEGREPDESGDLPQPRV